MEEKNRDTEERRLTEPVDEELAVELGVVLRLFGVDGEGFDVRARIIRREHRRGSSAPLAVVLRRRCILALLKTRLALCPVMRWLLLLLLLRGRRKLLAKEPPERIMPHTHRVVHVLRGAGAGAEVAIAA